NCMKAAIGRTATFDAQTEDLARNWKPTGVYTPADVRTIVATTMKMVAPASSALIAAFENEPLETQVGNLRQAGDDLDRKGKQGLAYLDAAAEAEAKGTYVEADLKTWVLYTRNAASSA